MEDKKQDVKSLEELVKTADSYRAFFANLADELSKVLADIKAPEKEEDTWKMKCPYENNDDIYSLSNDGEVKKTYWSYFDYDRERFEQGNIFPTKEAAELEAKRRNLLTRFRAFRDECNGDWKPDFTINSNKYFIEKRRGKIVVDYIWTVNSFILFGYFKNHEDAKRAIELFGDEIEELFVDCEVQ